MKISEVIVVVGEDWCGLYIDGELVYENHSISLFELNYNCKNIPITLTYYQTTSNFEEVLENLGRFPENFSEIDVNLLRKC